MNWLIDNWSLLVVLLAFIVCGVVAVRKFLKLPTEEQIKSVKEWLLICVSVVEREMGSGTGRLKLRAAYQKFCETFPWVAKAISFERFSIWVDEALIEMRKLLESNEAVKGFIEG